MTKQDQSVTVHQVRQRHSCGGEDLSYPIPCYPSGTAGRCCAKPNKHLTLVDSITSKSTDGGGAYASIPYHICSFFFWPFFFLWFLMEESVANDQKKKKTYHTQPIRNSVTIISDSVGFFVRAVPSWHHR